MSYVKTSVNYISFFFFPSNQQLQHTPKQVRMDVSFWAKLVRSIDVSSFHTQDFYSHSAFTNLRYRRIQEHVVILLSNNCAVFVVHF